jgi:hypothetical protein
MSIKGYNMSDQHLRPQKIWFWTDKRPIAPNVETSITCAIAEIGLRVYSIFAGLTFFGIVFQIALGSETRSNFHILFGYSLFLLAGFLMFLVGSPLRDQSNLDRLSHQSGIPQKRTQISRALISVSALIFVGLIVYIVYNMIHHIRLEDSDFAALSSLYLVCVISSLSAAAIERVRWVLELRAEQGHVLDFGEEGEEADTGSRIPWYRRATR